MKKINLNKINRAHFIGAGGIGISTIARMLLLKGKKVTGSDRETGKVTKELQKLGAVIKKGQNAKNIPPKTDLVIYTKAVPNNHPELAAAKKRKITVLSYPEALGLVSKEKFTIAVSGAHGKTTTTAMLGGILSDAKLDPTIIVGSFMKNKKPFDKARGKTNFVAGKSKYLVCEACEYKKSFLNLSPKIIIITNIDNDHLDYYKNIENIRKAFAEFISKLSKNDYLVCDKTDKNTTLAIKNAIRSHLPAGRQGSGQAKCKIVDFSKIKLPKNFKLKIPGEHNIKNAKAALATAKILKIKEKTALKSLENFTGTWRRFEYKGKTKNGALVYDDYGHHPTEIRATLAAARIFFKNKKITAVFQPHLYSRTKLLMEDFAGSFCNADSVIIAPIYAAREIDDKKTSGKTLAEKIKKYNPNAIYLSDFGSTEKHLKKYTGKKDAIITIGAGDIYKIGEKLIKN
jgi:UDP-N-acetylmuramate--alanine ligase